MPEDSPFFTYFGRLHQSLRQTSLMMVFYPAFNSTLENVLFSGGVIETCASLRLLASLRPPYRQLHPGGSVTLRFFV